MSVSEVETHIVTAIESDTGTDTDFVLCSEFENESDADTDVVTATEIGRLVLRLIQ